MKDAKLKKMVLTALMAAMTMVATMSIKVPSPTGGYIHPGDGVVIIAGIILGPLYGSWAAGIGSMFADLFSGYGAFAPATLIIKACAAFISSILYYQVSHNLFKIRNKTVAVTLGGIGAGIIVTVGYFLFEAYVLGLGFGAAFAGVGFNIIQNVFGILVSIVLLPALLKIPVVKDSMGKTVSDAL